MANRTEEQRRRNIEWTIEYNKQRRVQRNGWLRDWCKRHPEARFLRYMRHRLKKKYGITILEYTQMLRDQERKCAICKREMHVTSMEDRSRNGKSATVDHDSATGVVRGLLCNNCNRAIGLLEHDVTVMQNAIEYLRQARDRAVMRSNGN